MSVGTEAAVASPPIPGTLAEALSPAWLTAALRTRFPDVEVHGVEPGRVISRVSTNAPFRIDCTGVSAEELPRDLYVKGYFTDAGDGSADPVGLGEALFYGSIAERTGVRTLRSVYADADPGTRASIVVTVDVEAQGGSFLDPLSDYTPDQVAQSLEQYAQLHAATWLDPEVGRLRWLDTWLPHVLLGRGVPVIQGNFDGPIGAGVPERTRDAQRLQDAYALVADEATTASPWSVVHGDAHVGNLFLDSEGRSCLVDWQIVQRGPWYLDVGYHIASSLPAEQRRASERDLLRHYLDALASHGVDRPSDDEALRLIRRGIVHGFYLWAITLKVAPPITTELLTRLGTAADDHDALAPASL